MLSECELQLWVVVDVLDVAQVFYCLMNGVGSASLFACKVGDYS